MGEALPKYWVESQLIEVLQNLQTGVRPKGGVQGIKEGIPSIGGEHLNSDGGFNFKNIKYIPIDFANKLKRGQIFNLDILIVKDGATTGRTSFVDQGFPFNLAFVNEHVFLCRPYKNIVAKYLYYFMRSKVGQNRIMANFAGAAQGGINTKFASNTLIPLAPLAEQERIVAKLDILFGQVALMKKSLDCIPQLLKDFRQQVLTQAITGKLTEDWREGKKLVSYIDIIKYNRIRNFQDSLKRSKLENLKRPRKLIEEGFELNEIDQTIGFPGYWILENLKNVCDFITDGEHATPKRTEQGCFLLSARNIRDGFLALENVDYVDDSEFSRLKQRCNPEYKDVLISCSGSVGRVTQFPNDIKAVMVRSAALLKLQSNVEISKFVEFALRSQIGQKQIEKLTKSTAQPNLFLEPIGKIVIPIPSIEEQNEIVSQVECLFAKADTIENQYKILKEKIESLPQTILHKAFKGELVAQLPTDGDAKDLLEEIRKLKIN